MRTNAYVFAALALAGVIGCSANGPPTNGSTAPPPEATMVAEFTDFAEPIPADGTLSFILVGTGEESIEVGAGGYGAGTSAGAGVATHLSRARAADLVAGRLVESTGLEAGGFPTMTTQFPGGVQVVRPVLSIRLVLDGESSVRFTAQLGAAEGVGVPTPELPPTATLTVRGQMRLTCQVPPEPGGTSTRLDPAFTSPFCAGLRTELGLDALLAISNSI